MLEEIRKHGYAIRKSIDYIDPKIVKYLFKLAKNKKSKRGYLDTKRWIMYNIKFKTKYMKKFHREYRKSIKGINFPIRSDLLYSEKNCPRQEIHRDREFDNEEVKQRGLMTNILAIMDNTRIMVRRKEVVLKAGEMIFFKPTTLHCGLSYKNENVRLIQWSYKN